MRIKTIFLMKSKTTKGKIVLVNKIVILYYVESFRVFFV